MGSFEDRRASSPPVSQRIFSETIEKGNQEFHHFLNLPSVVVLMSPY
jgi:hypothetical protein